MFQIGDKISYPMHGAGCVEAIEEKEVMGAVNTYYVLFFYGDGVKVMIPLDRAKAANLRYVLPEADVPKVLKFIRECEVEEMFANWNRRYRHNLDKLKEGDIYSTIQVMKALYIRDQRRGLSAGEKKMLQSSRRFVVGELTVAGGFTDEDSERMLDEALASVVIAEEIVEPVILEATPQ